MRVDAAEFVPAGAGDTAGASSGSDALKASATGSNLSEASKGVLSADTPEFVPGALHAGDQPGYWSQAGYSNGAAGYNDGMQYVAPADDSFGYVDEETFLTPQLLPEQEEKQSLEGQKLDEEPEKQGADGTVAAPNGKATAEVEEWPALGDLGGRRSKRAGKGGKGVSGAPDPISQTTEDSAPKSAGSSSSSSRSVGSLHVEGRQLQWMLTSDDCASPEPRALEEVPQGECLHSSRFCVAGVVLQLAFFPSGTSLTGERDSAVAVLCEEKTKLKFELFLNGRRSGTKVMLGQKFSCDFRKPDMSGSQSVVVGIEVYSNLFYSGFY